MLRGGEQKRSTADCWVEHLLLILCEHERHQRAGQHRRRVDSTVRQAIVPEDFVHTPESSWVPRFLRRQRGHEGSIGPCPKQVVPGARVNMRRQAARDDRCQQLVWVDGWGERPNLSC